jgi:hypothetical protein
MITNATVALPRLSMYSRSFDSIFAPLTAGNMATRKNRAPQPIREAKTKRHKRHAQRARCNREHLIRNQ